MTCAPCTDAQDDPLRHYYANGCTSCQARAIAALGLHQDSINAGRVLPEMGELLRTLFKDGPTEGWAAVREWGVKVDRARKAQQQKADDRSEHARTAANARWAQQRGNA